VQDSAIANDGEGFVLSVHVARFALGFKVWSAVSHHSVTGFPRPGPRFQTIGKTHRSRRRTGKSDVMGVFDLVNPFASLKW
jgi:hypothetical protein